MTHDFLGANTGQPNARKFVILEDEDVPIYPGTRAIPFDREMLALPDWARVGLAVGTFVATENIGAAAMVYMLTGDNPPEEAPPEPGPIIINAASVSAEDIDRIVSSGIRVEALRQLQVKINSVQENMRYYHEMIAEEHKDSFIRETLIPAANQCKADAESLQPEGTGAYWIAVSQAQAILLEAISRGVIQLSHWKNQTQLMEYAFDRSLTSCRQALLKRYEPVPRFPLNHPDLATDGEYYFYSRDGIVRDRDKEASYVEHCMLESIMFQEQKGLEILAHGIWDYSKARGITGNFVQLRNAKTGKYMYRGYGSHVFYFRGATGAAFLMVEKNGRCAFRDINRLFLMHSRRSDLIIPGTPDENQAEFFDLISYDNHVKLRAQDGRYWTVRPSPEELALGDEQSAAELIIEPTEYVQPQIMRSSVLIENQRQ
jgi:hypothetical protein